MLISWPWGIFFLFPMHSLWGPGWKFLQVLIFANDLGEVKIFQVLISLHHLRCSSLMASKAKMGQLAVIGSTSGQALNLTRPDPPDPIWPISGQVGSTQVGDPTWPDMTRHHEKMSGHVGSNFQRVISRFLWEISGWPLVQTCSSREDLRERFHTSFL